MAIDLGWKLISAGAGIVSGIVANKLIDAVWGALSGHGQPDVEDPNEPLVDVIVFTLVSGAVTSLVGSLATRSAAKWYGKGEAIGRQALEADEAR